MVAIVLGDPTDWLLAIVSYVISISFLGSVPCVRPLMFHLPSTIKTSVFIRENGIQTLEQTLHSLSLTT